MNVVPFLPDQMQMPVSAPLKSVSDAQGFAGVLDGVGGALSRADSAEDAFAAHAGSLQDAVFERAQADVVLSIATAAAQRSAQALQSVLNMQI